MQTIVLGQIAKFHLGLINADTREPIPGAGFRDTTFDFSESGIVTATVDTDPFFFNATPQAVGTVSFAVHTTAEHNGIQESKQYNDAFNVIPTPPPTELTVTRVS